MGIFGQITIERYTINNNNNNNHNARGSTEWRHVRRRRRRRRSRNPRTPRDRSPPFPSRLRPGASRSPPVPLLSDDRQVRYNNMYIIILLYTRTTPHRLPSTVGGWCRAERSCARGSSRHGSDLAGVSLCIFIIVCVSVHIVYNIIISSCAMWCTVYCNT